MATRMMKISWSVQRPFHLHESSPGMMEFWGRSIIRVSRVKSTQVDEAGVRPGLVDFGDFVRSCRVFDLAILLAYALFDGKGSSMTSLLADSVLDPSETMLILQRACTIVSAYHSVCPLLRVEIDALYVLIRARNCQTILNAAHHFRLDPDPYKLVSAEPAKRLLRQLEQWDAATFSDALRAACQVK